ncbi:AcrB/AcrD/AcrF family protein [Chryseotalea sanaruensis]|uniref:AcrB/AcrD/AcrF family protein n=1 Tax=Chryseotalea sanaruensis TaxID=2482724 RepID=A0A401U7L3_9BACT|nr:efflux RND transporter permease subunit [Chryseotalea sanaruensis]GCC50878.1 AcrB/AcrD/AcrF family protein [Chryseotalea sanaruensis]
MLRFLLQRPIAITMCLIVSAAISIVAFWQLPVSLLPAIDVPEITISVKSPNSSAQEIEQNILKTIRENMLSLNGLKAAESIAQDETGRVSLHFEYGTNMTLSYIEANEKIDRLTPQLPQNLERPIVIKSSTADLPIVRIQVSPKNENDILQLSELTSKVLKRRLEQLAGVGLVDINGTVKRVIRIAPNYEVLKSLNLSESTIAQTIENANLDLGSVSVKDGNYRYFLKLSAKVTNPEDVENLPILLPEEKGVIKLKNVANIYYEAEKPLGFHLYGSQQGLVITVHKQMQAKMPELMPVLYKVVEQFKADYPQFEFDVTQDQSLLLTLSINNLSQSLLWGGLFAFAVLFLFMRGWREPLIMGIVLPVSLLLAFSLFYAFNISLNIISLSGLALGLGMLVDNSIVVIDNIMMKRKEGCDLLDSCVVGTQEVIVPLLSSALTNMAVFIPLIYMSGITGALFFDQALSIAAILSVSILCTFIVVPLIYILFFKNRKSELQADSFFFEKMKDAYERSFLFIWQHKKLSLLLMSMLIPIAVALLFLLPKQGFPEIERTETIIEINWNEPIDAVENKQRTIKFIDYCTEFTKQAEADIGHQQFLLSTENYSVQHALVYLAYHNANDKIKSDPRFIEYFLTNYPLAKIKVSAAPNSFEQLFQTSRPVLEARFRDNEKTIQLSEDQVNDLLQITEAKAIAVKGKGLETETMAYIYIDFDKLKLYQLNYQDVIRQLKIAFGEYQITDFKSFGDVTPVLFSQYNIDFESALRAIEIKSVSGINYPLKDFVTYEFKDSFKNITADAAGVYQSISLSNFDDPSVLEPIFTTFAKQQNLVVDLTGTWFETKENLSSLILILLVSVLLMYFILTAEFESLKQPFLVMLTFPLGFAGSLMLLWISGGSLNIMSGIGMIVVLGILDNDAILKIDRINKLRETLPLEKAIKQAGLDRLKPIVMNTCTNVLAITPIIFSSGIGADLQRPIAITTIGGLIVGTFTALYFVPLLYWFSSSKKNKALQ